MLPLAQPAMALLIFAALLAGFAAAVRALSQVDNRPRPALLAVAAGALRGSAVRLHDALVCARGMENPELTWSVLMRAAVMDSDLDRLAMARRHLAEAATLAQERLTHQHLASVFAELAWLSYLD